MLRKTEDDEDFSKKLGALGDVYINDAFSCSIENKHPYII